MNLTEKQVTELFTMNFIQTVEKASACLEVFHYSDVKTRHVTYK